VGFVEVNEIEAVFMNYRAKRLRGAQAEGGPGDFDDRDLRGGRASSERSIFGGEQGHVVARSTEAAQGEQGLALAAAPLAVEVGEQDFHFARLSFW
jgi:hypothetical protein